MNAGSLPICALQVSSVRDAVAHHYGPPSSALAWLHRTPPPPALSSTQFEYQGLDLEEYAERHRAGATTYLDGVATGLAEEGVSARPVILEGKIADELGLSLDR